MAGPLEGVRVLDLSRVLAGPWASQNLADLGAEVIKIERPGAGDDTRGWGPPYVEDAAGQPSEVSAYFLSANRGKRSVTVDFTRPEGQEILRRLAAESDVVLENYKFGGLRKYGLDHDGLRAVNPRLIYCSITGFGQTGPYRQRTGYDFLLQAMGGLMSVTGEPGGEPMKVGVAITDILTGMYASTAILAALHERGRSGEGQHIDLALFDVQIATLANQALNYLVSGREPRRLGNAHPSIVPYQSFATVDGDIVLAVGNDEQFRRFVTAAGRPDLAEDERFRTNTGRVRNREVLVPLLRDIVAGQTTAQWLAQLEPLGVPCGPVNGVAAAFADPQAQARGMRLEMRHPELGTVPSVASPMRFSRTPIAYEQAPPRLGEHTEAVLRERLGASEAEIAQWREQGTI
ncbi:CoA-transferase, family III protein [Roseomonas mucosa]|uniref:Formyl-coenzyme A transferase n=1 Tax=Roseomonas mucosa TaxID=207340 RepID=A0A379MWC3_9PROT|nr:MULTISPECIES: CaiB/BaiF CoA-transferase family protein [Roseomonas]MBS5904331.1 CoA transferase [Acetobacteraceae bacterium]AWV23840.1 CoA-transferase, family III protein [Roseomonas mucosa]MCG7351315.1 CoA transferase [Roseomonas mucosa]MCG7356885.1 CoA transferase [Roseomonas mucosa]MDT8290983.1 CaiB/BaiF CoA-transferase family protein [Roseomonas mucosa]